MTQSIRTRAAALAVGALVALSACGSDSGPGPDAELQARLAEEDAAASAGQATPEPGEAADASGAPGAVVENSESLAVVGDPLPPLEDPSTDPSVGTAAPVITGVNFDGTEVTIGGPSDGPTMLVFLAHWCPHCNDEIPEIITLRDRGDLPENLNIIGISTAVQSDRDNFPPSSWIAEKAWTWPVLADTSDSAAIQAYGGSGFPFTVMLNADGTVNARKSGSESADQILEWIDAALLAA